MAKRWPFRRGSVCAMPARGSAVIFSRPKDDTFEAYKAWILSMTRALTGQDNDDMTWVHFLLALIPKH